MSTSPARTGTARPSALAEDLRLLIGTLKRRLREQGQRDDLPPSQVAILLRLEKHGPATVSSLARSEGMRPQSMGAAIAALETAGLVRAEKDGKFVNYAPQPQILKAFFDRLKSDLI